MTPDWSTQSFECPGFFLLNVHLFNLPLALLSHFLLPRQLVFLDFWVATIFAVAYLRLAYFGGGAGDGSLGGCSKIGSGKTTTLNHIDRHLWMDSCHSMNVEECITVLCCQ